MKFSNDQSMRNDDDDEGKDKHNESLDWRPCHTCSFRPVESPAFLCYDCYIAACFVQRGGISVVIFSIPIKDRGCNSYTKEPDHTACSQAPCP